MKSSMYVTVMIVDVDDQQPTCNQSIYNVELIENSSNEIVTEIDVFDNDQVYMNWL
jgi:hypothetical protein